MEANKTYGLECWKQFRANVYSGDENGLDQFLLNITVALCGTQRNQAIFSS